MNVVWGYGFGVWIVSLGIFLKGDLSYLMLMWIGAIFMAWALLLESGGE